MGDVEDFEKAAMKEVLRSARLTNSLLSMRSLLISWRNS